MKETIIIGAITGVAAFAVLTCIRNWFRYAIIRGKVTEDYLLGWRDACKTMAQRLEWVKNDGEDRKSRS